MSKEKKEEILSAIPRGEIQPGSLLGPDPKAVDWPHFIGAVQGHSIAELDEDRMYPTLTADDLPDIPAMIHGTSLGNIGSILILELKRAEWNPRPKEKAWAKANLRVSAAKPVTRITFPHSPATMTGAGPG